MVLISVVNFLGDTVFFQEKHQYTVKIKTVNLERDAWPKTAVLQFVLKCDKRLKTTCLELIYWYISKQQHYDNDKSGWRAMG